MKHRVKPKPIIGKRDAQGSRLKAVKQVRTWHCKIGRLEDDISMQDIIDYLSDGGVNAIKVEKLPQRQGATASIHIIVPYDSKDIVMNDDLWTDGVRIRGWFFVKSKSALPS